jgi:hypothetical protein
MKKEEMQLDIQNKFSSFSDQNLKISVPDFPNAKNGTKTSIPPPNSAQGLGFRVCCFYDFNCNMIPNFVGGCSSSSS